VHLRRGRALTVERVDPNDKRALADFARLDQELNAGAPRFVAEPLGDVKKRLRRRSPTATHLELALFADRARRAQAVAYVNPVWQEHHGETVGFVGGLVGADRDGLVDVIGAATGWLSGAACTRAIAGVEGSALIGIGLYDDERGDAPRFPMRWQPPLVTEALAEAGFSPSYPFWSYDVDLTSPTYHAAAAKALENDHCTVRTVDKKRWKDEIALLADLFNAGFADEWEMNPFRVDEFMTVTGQLKPILDAGTMLFAEVAGEPVGLCFGMPDLNPLFRQFGGRLGPLQVLTLLRKGRRPAEVGLLGVCLRPGHRGKGIGQTLAAHLYERYRELGYRTAAYYVVNESNLASRGLATSFGGQGRVVATCWDRPL
jgi:ribosomal protein S18 acetylase RimI-like enzyme